jgi:hypothetical protein
MVIAPMNVAAIVPLMEFKTVPSDFSFIKESETFPTTAHQINWIINGSRLSIINPPFVLDIS